MNDQELIDLKTRLEKMTESDLENKIVKSGLKLLVKLLLKNKAYGSAVFSNNLLTPDVDLSTGIRVRLGDKISRLSNLIGNPAINNLGEDIKETVFDSAGYFLLWYTLLESKLEPEDLK